MTWEMIIGIYIKNIDHDDNDDDNDNYTTMAIMINNHVTRR